VSPYCSDITDTLTAYRCDGTCVSAAITTYCFFLSEHVHICHGVRASLLLFLNQFGGAMALHPNTQRHPSRCHWCNRKSAFPISAKVLEMMIGAVAAALYITPLKRAQMALRRRRGLLPLHVKPRFALSRPAPHRIAPRRGLFCDGRDIEAGPLIGSRSIRRSNPCACARNGGVAARLADLPGRWHVLEVHTVQFYSRYRATERDQTSVSDPRPSPHDSDLC
jgi:hypothetical protein